MSKYETPGATGSSTVTTLSASQSSSQKSGFEMDNPMEASTPGQRKLVLCFDGTGNKFHGDDSDSNILKIFRMLDRSAENQYHYYQRMAY